MNAYPQYRLVWVFRNDHEWSKTFDSLSELTEFVNTTGLVTHPDITTIAYYEGPGSAASNRTILKREN